MAQEKKTVKVTINLPPDLYETVERERHRLGESRSSYLRDSVEQAVRLRQEEEARWWAQMEEEDRLLFDEPDSEPAKAIRRAWMTTQIQVLEDYPYIEDADGKATE